MAKYRKRPVIIEATQWFVNGDHPQVTIYPRGGGLCKQCQHWLRAHGWIDTLEGGHIVCPGDWIIQGVAQEFYPCKPDVFEKTYERVED